MFVSRLWFRVAKGRMIGANTPIGAPRAPDAKQNPLRVRRRSLPDAEAREDPPQYRVRVDAPGDFAHGVGGGAKGRRHELG